MFDTSAILENARIAVGDYLRKHTVAVWQEFPEETPFIGSGTCIEINDRLFISTAAHNFKDVPRGGKVTLLSANSSSRIPLKVIGQNYGYYGHSRILDTAWVEIDVQSAEQENLFGVPLHTVEPHHVIDIENGNYEVVGLPMQLHSVTEDRTHYIVPLAVYNTMPGKSADPDDDNLMLDYSETAMTNQGIVTMPHPGGMSGGGIWSVPLVDRPDIWIPSKFRLAGIVTDYFHLRDEICGQIRGLRMHHWLKLVLNDHPELREHIGDL